MNPLPAFAVGCRSLGLALVLVAPLAAASEEDFQRFYNAALRLHESLEYERALEQLALARKQASTGDQMSQVSLAEGVVLADLNRGEEAMAAFKQGLLLSPDAAAASTGADGDGRGGAAAAAQREAERRSVPDDAARSCADQRGRAADGARRGIDLPAQ